ncbi:MAG: hypothetical protein F6K09_39385 [Merismopedia sp. SIO2A8]|nr:hypothetical protein [Merismopedia sp. SIO2A8]
MTERQQARTIEQNLWDILEFLVNEDPKCQGNSFLIGEILDQKRQLSEDDIQSAEEILSQREWVSGIRLPDKTFVDIKLKPKVCIWLTDKTCLSGG